MHQYFFVRSPTIIIFVEKRNLFLSFKQYSYDQIKTPYFSDTIGQKFKFNFLNIIIPKGIIPLQIMHEEEVQPLYID